MEGKNVNDNLRNNHEQHEEDEEEDQDQRIKSAELLRKRMDQILQYKRMNKLKSNIISKNFSYFITKEK